MKRLILLLAVLLTFPVTVAGKECGYIGSWLGYDSNGELFWTSHVTGVNASGGTVILEVPGFDMTFDGLFDVANYTTTHKGVWKRTGGHTYSMDGYSIATNGDGDAVYVMRLGCDASLKGDCDVLEIQACAMSLYFPDPGSDPIPIWQREPDLGPIYFPPHNGYRMTVD
jgi:hypothetical protein